MATEIKPEMKVQAEYKRLIVCCDGTWQASDKGPRTVPSNITKFARALETAQVRDDKQEIQQVVYYQAGVASGSHFAFERAYTGNLGIGLDANVISAYYFLSNNYDPGDVHKKDTVGHKDTPGDEIFLFGFSRGAYTARCVAALVSRFGIIAKRHMDRFPILYDAYRTRKSEKEFDDAFEEMKKHFPTRYPARITVMGCWDTVGAMGLPEFWWVEKLGLNNEHKFRDVELSDNVENAFHAMALDDHRTVFTPALWHLPKTTTVSERLYDAQYRGVRNKKNFHSQNGRTMPNLVQCWFPGVHVNSGGGSDKNLLALVSQDNATEGGSPAAFNEETDMEELADITFAWMVDQCRPFLSFDSQYLAQTATQHKNLLKARHHPEPAPGYAVGPIKDSYIPILGYFMGGSSFRTPGQYNDRNKNYDPNYISYDTNECFHPSVRARWQALGMKWKPSPIHGWDAQYVKSKRDKKHTGWIWVKKLPNGKEVEIPECRIDCDAKSMERQLMHDGTLSMLGED
ncbi:hypothetical protein FRB93_011748 [Tulasnella sp. JGI-2019a]|nr:hypothetical protein FRB93_011748 [Tulasnella sp. JGI-2019a]